MISAYFSVFQFKRSCLLTFCIVSHSQAFPVPTAQERGPLGALFGWPLFSGTEKQPNLVALYRAMRLRCGYGFESCDANGPRNVKNTNIAKHRPIFLPPVLLVGSKELVLKVPKRGHFHVAIRVTRKRCDSCAQVAQGTRTVSRRNF